MEFLGVRVHRRLLQSMDLPSEESFSGWSAPKVAEWVQARFPNVEGISEFITDKKIVGVSFLSLDFNNWLTCGASIPVASVCTRIGKQICQPPVAAAASEAHVEGSPTVTMATSSRNMVTPIKKAIRTPISSPSSARTVTGTRSVGVLDSEAMENASLEVDAAAKACGEPCKFDCIVYFQLH